MKITQPRTDYTQLVSNVPSSGASYNNTGSGLTATDVQAAIDELVTGITGTYLTVVGGGRGTVQAHGNLGATETIDLAAGNYHWGTLNANCTIGFTGWTNLKDCQITVELIEDGTGGWTPTFTGVTWIGGATPAHVTTAGTMTLYAFLSRDGGTTIYGAMVSVAAILIKDEGTPLATAATSLDFVGAGVVASGAGAAKTITVSGAATSIDPSLLPPGHVHVDNVVFSGDGATTAFELPASPVDAYSVGAYIAGVRQNVTLSGALLTTMTFASAPASGTDNIYADIAAVLA